MRKQDLPNVLRNEKSFSDRMQRHLREAPRVNDDDRKKRRAALIKSLKDNEKRLTKLKAIKETPEITVRKLKLQLIINKQIFRLQEMQAEELARIERAKIRRQRLAATINEEMVRLEKGKLVPKKKFKHQDEINKVFGPSDLAARKKD